MTEKILTVLIPTYNDYSAFLKVINSYIDDNRVKIIVSDDSNDNNKKLAIKNECKKRGIEYNYGPHSTPAANWNYLLKKVSTPFFVLNHHNDIPDSLSFLELLKKEIGILVLPCTSYPLNKGKLKIYSWQQFILLKIFSIYPNAKYNLFLAPTASVILNREFRDNNFDTSLIWFVDCDWYNRIIKKVICGKKKISFFPHSRIISYQKSNSITISLGKRIKEIARKELIIVRNKKLLPNHLIDFLQRIIFILVLLLSKIKQSFSAR